MSPLTSPALPHFLLIGTPPRRLRHPRPKTLSFVAWNDGGGRFSPRTVFGASGVQNVTVAVGDLNGDGRPDLVQANRGLSRWLG